MRWKAWTLAALTLAAAGGALGQDWRGGRARVEGTVRNAKGEPIAGCKVMLRWGRSGHGGPDLTTDAQGRFAIFGLSGGPWDVDFEAAGYVTKKINVALQESGRNPSVDVQLEAAQAAAPPPPAVTPQTLVGGKKVSKETADAIEAGNAAMAARNWAGARENYEKAVAELPDNVPLLERVAATYLAEGKADDALTWAQRAADKDPNEYGAWRMVAQIQLQKGNLEAGQAALDRVPPDKISDPQPYLNIGILLLNKKKPAEAVAAFDKALAVKPDLPDAYYYRGLARMQMKKSAEAKADLQKALELAPDGPDAKDIKDLLKTLS